MVLEIKKNVGPFKMKQIWFAQQPYDVDGVGRIIFRDCKNKVNAPGFSFDEFTTLVVDLTRELDGIWADMDKSSCRYAIRRAERDGIVVKINEDAEKFCKLNKNFRKKKGLFIGPSDSLGFIIKNGTLFTAYYNNKIISGSFFLEDMNNIRWLFGASDRLIVDTKQASIIGNANRLIIWEAIKYAKNKNIKEFDFGGYLESSNDEQKINISLFKKSFGGSVVSRYVYKKDYSYLYKLISKSWLFLKNIA